MSSTNPFLSSLYGKIDDSDLKMWSANEDLKRELDTVKRQLALRETERKHLLEQNIQKDRAIAELLGRHKSLHNDFATFAKFGQGSSDKSSKETQELLEQAKDANTFLAASLAHKAEMVEIYKKQAEDLRKQLTDLSRPPPGFGGRY